MITLYIAALSLLATGITASPNCLQKIAEAKRNAMKHHYPCGVPSPENCCVFKENPFDQSPCGVYKLNSWCSGRLSVVGMYCDTTTDNGGWTVIQRRKDGSENFNRSWGDYERGFGDLNGEFWYGLKAINCLTKTGQWELRVDFEFADKTRSHLHYTSFKVGSATDEYPLTIGGFTGITSTDPFSSHPLNGLKFSTYNNDNDKWGANCAAAVGRIKGSGGWWHNSCWHVNLNIPYKPAEFGYLHISGKWLSPSWVEMKIRPLNCTTD